MRTLQIATILLTLVLLSGTAVVADWTMFVTDSQASSPTVFGDRIYSTPVTAIQGAFMEPQDLRPLPRDYYSPSYRGAPIESTATEETTPDIVTLFFIATILVGILWLLVTSREEKTPSSHVAYMIELVKSTTKWNGRFDRRRYATIFVSMTLISIVIGFLLGFAQSVIKSEGVIVVLLAIGLLTWYIICIIVGVGAAVRRFHDLDLSGWFVLLLVIPLVGSLTFLYLVFKPGKVGKTRWGEGVDDAQSTLDEFTAEVAQSKEDSETKRKAIITVLNKLEEDYEAGEVSDADYKRLSSKYEKQAIEIMKQLDRM